MSNILEAFLKGLDLDPDEQYVDYMTREQFSEYLHKLGYSYPTHDRPGSRYLNVFGAAARVNTKKPYALVIYKPRPLMREEYYKSPEEALEHVPDGDILWQVLNLWTMDVIFDPFNTGKGEENRGGVEVKN